MKTVRTQLLATAAMVSLGSAAYAADIPLKAPPPAAPVAPVSTWTGFYVGGQIGGATFDPRCSQSNNNFLFSQNGNIACSSTPVNPPSFVGMPRTSNAAGGFKAGYDWQYNTVVLGVVGDLNWTSLRSSVTGPNILEAPPGSAATAGLDWLASIRGRLGWSFGDLLVYGTGGVAWARVTGSNGISGTCCGDWNASSVSTRTGGVAGGGVEYRYSQHVSFTGEVLWYGGFGTQTFSGICSCTFPTETNTYTTNIQIRDVLLATVGMNFRF
jgi:outer membrane immunogenic protein